MEPEKKYLQSSLKDCGFDEKDTKKYLEYASDRRRAEQIRLLRQQRKRLMENLHRAQRQVDTVDYMLRSVQEQS